MAATPGPLPAAVENFSIGPSILGADFTILSEEIKSCLSAGAGHLHLDVMDGHFVPNISFGMPVVKAIRSKFSDPYLDVHMMVSNPGAWVEGMHAAGANCYTFHTEALDNDVEKCVELVEKIKSYKMHTGVSLKPKTPAEVAIKVLERTAVDQVLIMTVEPGFGGQTFMYDQVEKIKAIRSWATNNNRENLIIQADGGVKIGETADAAAKAGCNWLVSGSGVLKAANREDAIAAMKTSLQNNYSA